MATFLMNIFHIFLLVHKYISGEVEKLYVEFNGGLPGSLIHLIYEAPYFLKNFYNI